MAHHKLKTTNPPALVTPPPSVSPPTILAEYRRQKALMQDAYFAGEDAAAHGDAVALAAALAAWHAAFDASLSLMPHLAPRDA